MRAPDHVGWPSSEYDVPPTCPWCGKPIDDGDSYARVAGTELFAHQNNARPSCHELVQQVRDIALWPVA